MYMYLYIQGEIPGVTQVEKGRRYRNTVTAYVGSNMEHGLLHYSKRNYGHVLVSRNY